MSGLLLGLGVALAGGLGATLRFVIDMSIPARLRAHYPWGTWVINLTGSFILGVVAGPLAGLAWGPIVTIGVLGGYTTFSAASLETVTLAEDGKWWRAVLYGLGTLVLCALVAYGGIYLTR